MFMFLAVSHQLAELLRMIVGDEKLAAAAATATAAAAAWFVCILWWNSMVGWCCQQRSNSSRLQLVSPANPKVVKANNDLNLSFSSCALHSFLSVCCAAA
jgi:hypothetical protein